MLLEDDDKNLENLDNVELELDVGNFDEKAITWDELIENEDMDLTPAKRSTPVGGYDIDEDDSNELILADDGVNNAYLPAQDAFEVFGGNGSAAPSQAYTVAEPLADIEPLTIVEPLATAAPLAVNKSLMQEASAYTSLEPLADIEPLTVVEPLGDKVSSDTVSSDDSGSLTDIEPLTVVEPLGDNVPTDTVSSGYTDSPETTEVEPPNMPLQAVSGSEQAQVDSPVPQEIEDQTTEAEEQEDTQEGAENYALKKDPRVHKGNNVLGIALGAFLALFCVIACTLYFF
ncbi:hypothetical protein tpqmel_0459, partial [Candidatus Gastranaerophilus sp. (ex Termes propinquus)]